MSTATTGEFIIGIKELSALWFRAISSEEYLFQIKQVKVKELGTIQNCEH